MCLMVVGLIVNCYGDSKGVTVNDVVRVLDGVGRTVEKVSRNLPRHDKNTSIDKSKDYDKIIISKERLRQLLIKAFNDGKKQAYREIKTKMDKNNPTGIITQKQLDEIKALCRQEGYKTGFMDGFVKGLERYKQENGKQKK